MFDFKNAIIKANIHLRNELKITPLIYSHSLSAATKAKVYLKLENLQPTGSFKVRGAFNKILSLSLEERKAGVITASTGNHGAAVAYACNKLGVNAIVFVPRYASSTKISNITSYDAHVEFYGKECGATEKHARAYAKQHQQVYISPYNDLDVIAGQGTIAYEILEQLPEVNAILACVGGGGLISGIGGYVKAINDEISIVGCLPENSPVMYESIKANRILELETSPTLSDATAGNMDLDAITFDFNKQFVDEWILVSEAQIKAAMRNILAMEHMLIEGSVGVSIASLLKNKEQFEDKTVVIIISGANISVDTLREVIFD